jgi:hypothetical protein
MAEEGRGAGSTGEEGGEAGVGVAEEAEAGVLTRKRLAVLPLKMGL